MYSDNKFPIECHGCQCHWCQMKISIYCLGFLILELLFIYIIIYLNNKLFNTYFHWLFPPLVDIPFIGKHECHQKRMTLLTLTLLTPSFYIGCHKAVSLLFLRLKSEG